MLSNPERSTTCVTGRPRHSSVTFCTRSADLQRYEIGSHTFRDFRLLFGCAAETNCCRLKEIHRVLRVGRDCQNRFAKSRFHGRTQTGHGRHDHFVASIARRRCSALSRVHRHNYRGNFKNKATAEHRWTARAASPGGHRDERGAWFQQHLRASDAARSCCQTRYPQDQRPAEPP